MSGTHYDEIYADLACGAPVEAAERDRALEHAERCATCRLRLEDERALAAGLGALAADTAAAGAGPRAKAAALAALRAHTAATVAPPTAPWWRRSPLALAAAAAIAVAAVTAGLWFAARTTPPPQSAVAPVPAEPLTPPPSIPNPIEPPTPLASPVQGVGVRPRHHSDRKAPAAVAKRAVPKPETVTDYIPLTYLDDATAMESGHVVRVEVPRETLASFGLPAGSAGSGEYVKADVVVGDDGVARAIRFVR